MSKVTSVKWMSMTRGMSKKWKDLGISLLTQTMNSRILSASSFHRSESVVKVKMLLLGVKKQRMVMFLPSIHISMSLEVKNCLI